MRSSGMRHSRSIIGVFCFLLPGLLRAGAYLGTVDCTNDQDTPVPPTENFCIAGKTLSNDEDITPFGITHPPGYDGSGGTLEIKICVDSGIPSSAELIGPTQRAIATWNALLGRTGNCRNCMTIEEGPGAGAPAPFHAESLILHELGHCAMGLGHSNLEFDPVENPPIEGRETTSFTTSYDGSPLGIASGPDGIPGSLDDVQQTSGGTFPKSVHWFRTADNNPMIVDGTTIDLATYSRSAANLPVGHSWAANANRAVAASLGFPDTQAVMYSNFTRTQRRKDLTSDEVNMIKMGMAGEDSMAGTADDYTIDLQLVDDCASADITVRFLSLDDDRILGTCGARVDFSFSVPNPLLARHYTVVKPPTLPRLFVVINSDLEWDFSAEIFVGGFESGDTSEWSLTVP